MKTAMLAIFALAVIGCSKSEPSKPTSALILGRWTDTKDIRDAHQKEPATVEFFRDGTALLSWRFTLSGETHVAKHLLHWTFVESHRMKYEDRKGRLNMAGPDAIWVDEVEIAGDELKVVGEGPLSGFYRRGP